MYVNRMNFKLTNTWETVMKGKTDKQVPEKIPKIDRKSELKLVGIGNNSCNWDTRIVSLSQSCKSFMYSSSLQVLLTFRSRVHQLSLAMSPFFMQRTLSILKFCQRSTYQNVYHLMTIWLKAAMQQTKKNPDHCLQERPPDKSVSFAT